MYRAKRGIHSFYTLSFMQYVCVYTHADGCRFLSRSRRCALPSYRGGWRSHSSPRAAARGGGGGEKYPQPPSHPPQPAPLPPSLCHPRSRFSLSAAVWSMPLCGHCGFLLMFLNKLLSQKKITGFPAPFEGNLAQFYILNQRLSVGPCFRKRRRFGSVRTARHLLFICYRLCHGGSTGP